MNECRLQVLQRGLPRPKTLTGLAAVRPEDSLQGLPPKEAAEILLQNEIVLLLQHDAAKYPIKVRFLVICSMSVHSSIGDRPQTVLQSRKHISSAKNYSAPAVPSGMHISD